MTKMRNSALEKFRLWFEYLPSDEPILEMVRQRRRRQTLEDKQRVRDLATTALTLPGIRRLLVAKLRRVKR